MKIGIVTTWFERGAAYVSRQYRQALQGAHEVFIYARGGEATGEGDPRWDDARVTWGPRAANPTPAALHLPHFDAWLRRLGLEAVLFNEQRWWAPVVHCARRGIKTAAYVDYYTEQTLPLFGCYDLLVCNTRRHLSAFPDHPQAVLVPWGTDTALFRPAGPGPVRAGQVTFFHSCGMSPERKGTPALLQAFGRVRGPAALVIHSQVELARRLPAQAAQLADLQDAGRLRVEQGTVAAPGLYHLGDVYAYPSVLDGIGLTLAEALACGLPVVTSDNPPMNEFVTPACGRLVEIERLYSRWDGYYWPQCAVSVASLTAGLQHYVDHRHQLPALRQAAREHALRTLRWEENAADLPRILQEARILAGPQREEALRAALAFDRRQFNLAGSLQQLARHFPRAYGAARRAGALLRGRQG